MSEYYFTYNNVLIFNDIDYSYDYDHWNDSNSWKPIPDSDQYLINEYGEIIRKCDSFLIPTSISPDGDEIVSLDVGTTFEYLVEDLVNSIFPDDLDTSEDLDSSENSVDQELDDLFTEMTTEQPPVEQPDDHAPASASVEQYLSGYPIIVTDNDGEFVQRFASIRDMIAKTHGTEGWDPMVIYNACNSEEWYKCYGKMIRWDKHVYIRYELEQKMREMREMRTADD